MDVLRYSKGTEWYKEVPGLASPVEWFAEATTLCWQGDEMAFSGYEYPYTLEGTQPICEIMKKAYVGPINPYDSPDREFFTKRIAARSWISPQKFISGNKAGKTIHLSFGLAQFGNDRKCRGVWTNKRIRTRVRFDFCGTRLKIWKNTKQSLKIKYSGITP